MLFFVEILKEDLKMKMEALFIAAWIFYTIVIWSCEAKKELKSWMIWMFAAALSADGLATLAVCILALNGFKLTLHAVTGFASLMIMFLHFFWAIGAYFGVKKCAGYFQRYSIYAWLIWTAGFFSGIPLKK
jgi:uncharacterized repeat protein (TIGR03987 family)